MSCVMTNKLFTSPEYLQVGSAGSSVDFKIRKVSEGDFQRKLIHRLVDCEVSSNRIVGIPHARLLVDCLERHQYRMIGFPQDRFVVS